MFWGDYSYRNHHILPFSCQVIMSMATPTRWFIPSCPWANFTVDWAFNGATLLKCLRFTLLYTITFTYRSAIRNANAANSSPWKKNGIMSILRRKYSRLLCYNRDTYYYKISYLRTPSPQDESALTFVGRQLDQPVRDHLYCDLAWQSLDSMHDLRSCNGIKFS